MTEVEDRSPIPDPDLSRIWWDSAFQKQLHARLRLACRVPTAQEDIVQQALLRTHERVMKAATLAHPVRDPTAMAFKILRDQEVVLFLLFTSVGSGKSDALIPESLAS